MIPGMARGETMKKSSSVAVVTVATIALAIGCAQNDGEAVCVDSSNRVAPRESCGQVGGGYFWYYHGAYARTSYPAVGTLVKPGGTTVPARAGAVARGGFGSTASGRSAGA
jgi:hypothetical protein